MNVKNGWIAAGLALASFLSLPAAGFAFDRYDRGRHAPGSGCGSYEPCRHEQYRPWGSDRIHCFSPAPVRRAVFHAPPPPPPIPQPVVSFHRPGISIRIR